MSIIWIRYAVALPIPSHSPLESTQVLDCIDPSGVAYRKCLHELRSICGNKAILPSSYRFSSDLSVDRDPFAGGGYATAYKGTAGGSKVCIKRVRVYARDGPQRAIKVREEYRS